MGPFLGDGGKVISDPIDIANGLKEQYEKVFNEPNLEAKINDPKEFFKETECEAKVEMVFFTEMDVRDAIAKTSNNAAGPDIIPEIIWKNCRVAISEPITILWQKSLKTGEIPNIF